ncbi:MAG: hypothetical protein UT48_C0001G0038 [Parcubacteria group bacterium GW2011_GWE2_39_37]|uniref:Uncharacterized protein n=1 Tax=Candidatus Falkowbacteria bacterium GW2011_GWF2_39_8 TaxID=1618642 RepID=A0A0G0Q904_9BACT|nr:MAG: hypothetical protein UT48_C0001G0038 [Parcubacteria group bacterium GW2011_GWE2_39_37]KKR33811.1 MAG: hypothetical protein UT64_C0003G0032 [Candidatus Falkowbacteria bacterium GW2011_GWF2_39_8]
MTSVMEKLLPLFTGSCVPNGYDEDFKIRVSFLFKNLLKIYGLCQFNLQQINEDVESGSARVAVYLYVASQINGTFVRDHLFDQDKRLMMDAIGLAREAHSLLCGWRNIYGHHFGVPAIQI